MTLIVWLGYFLCCGIGMAWAYWYGNRRGYHEGRDYCLNVLWDEFEIKSRYIYSPSAREVLVRGEKRMEGKLTAAHSHVYWKGVLEERERADEKP